MRLVLASFPGGLGTRLGWCIHSTADSHTWYLVSVPDHVRGSGTETNTVSYLDLMKSIYPVAWAMILFSPSSLSKRDSNWPPPVL